MDSTVIELLQPFIVTSWYGHRNDREIPEPVREVWRKKFKGRRGPTQQSNVDLAILDAKGQVVHAFDGFRRPRPGPSRRSGPSRKSGPSRRSGRRGLGRNELAKYTARELRKAISLLDLSEAPSEKHSLDLPDLHGSGGIRVFVRLLDDRMTAYRAPVVEVVPMDDDDWAPLAYPEKQRKVEASTLKRWLSQVYPPGIMERTNPRTKKVYKIETTEGTLSLAPAGADGELRFAVLRGEVRLTDEGPDDFSYKGTLKVVLTYRRSESKVHSLRGVFEGNYTRHDRRHNRTRNLPLQAAFESRDSLEDIRVSSGDAGDGA